MKKLLLLPLLVIQLLSHYKTSAQTNIICTNSLAEQIMLGNYNPSLYLPSTILNHPDTIAKGLNNRISSDSLKSHLEKLKSFINRNTGSDTISSVKGIGATRRWIYSKFEQFSSLNENRLIPSYLQFDRSICSAPRHKNIFAVLPGTDTTDKSIVIIEGHVDSRCGTSCDTACIAEGMEDNGSGTALVIELARTMSKYAYKNTLVFILTIAEEQGLYGAEAFADYVKAKGISVKVVLNNDVIGGVICGQTSSPPSCTGLNDVDSTHVRLFSQGGFNSKHKSLARYVKLQYKEKLLPIVSVPMSIGIMTPEDRTGRSGDHVPFRQQGYTAIRFTSANEHGDGNPVSGYTDRQHTSNDILGIDTNNDNVIDNFYVDFNYLGRNAAINGVGAAMAAIGPKTPDFQLTSSADVLTIQITQQTQYLNYRVGVRTITNDWDSVYTFSGTLTQTISIAVPAAAYYVSVASVDDKETESLFSTEKVTNGTGINKNPETEKGIELLQNRPNPFDEATTISVMVNATHSKSKKAFIKVSDLDGKELETLNISLHEGINEVVYNHGYGTVGTYIYSLIIEGRVIQSKKMNFSN